MWLFFIVGFVNNIDQSKIDKALEIIRPYYNENVVTQSPVNNSQRYANGLSQCLRQSLKAKTEFLRDDIIIGDTPGETLIISGYFYNTGNIIIINDGILNINNADFNLDGDIIMVNKAQAMADSSTLNFIQHYIYHHIIFITDSAKFTITNCQTTFAGYPFNLSIAGFGEIVMQNVINHDWTTAGVSQSARATLNNVGIAGEWLFIDQCYVQFKNVDNFLSWYFFPDSSVVSISFPQGESVYEFYIDSTLSNVDGISYHVEIDSSTNCMWAAIPLKGCDVTIDSSELRVTGIMFQGSDTFALSGLVNGLYYPDWTLPLSDRNYHLINSTVQTWNLYPSDTVNVELYSSIFGELCAYGNSYAFIHNAFCDGSGGHIEASNNAFTVVYLSSIFADIITKGRGLCFIGYCSMPLGNIWATGASVMIFVNSQFPEDPIPSDTSIVFVEAITGPSNAYTEDTVGIMGSAWIDKGPYHPLDFGFYRLSSRVLGDSTWLPLGDSNTVEVRRDTLEYWNTVGLSPGVYEIRLVLKDNAGDSVECLKQITLRPTGIEEMVNYSDNQGLIVKQIKPRLFYIENSDNKSGLIIYDSSGRKILKSKSEKLFWSAPTAGVFFIRNSTITKKIVAY